MNEDDVRGETQQEYFDFGSMDEPEESEPQIFNSEQQRVIDRLRKEHKNELNAVSEELKGVKEQMGELLSLIKLIGNKPNAGE